ncbi:MAG TPA: hypothetical protein GX405_13820 [Rhizobiales bacterium]|nr:hypothetical protein [Hyphomicrobiales bacterium]
MGTAEALDVENALKTPPFEPAAGMRREVRWFGRFDNELPHRSPIAAALHGASTAVPRG